MFRLRRRMILLALAWTVPMAALVLAAAWRVPWTDEGAFSSAAYNLAHHGFFGTTVLDPAASGLVRIDQRTYWVMPLYLLLQAAWLLVFPASVFSVRLLTVITVPLAAWLVYRVTLLLTEDPDSAVVAALLFGYEYNVLYAGSWGRPDLFCLLFGLAAVVSYLSLRVQSIAKALALAAFWTALSLLTHPNALIHIACVFLLALWLDRGRLRFRPVALAVLVGVAVLIPYALFVASDVEAFRGQISTNATARFAGSWNPLLWIRQELVERYARAYGLLSAGMLARLKALPLLTYLISLIAAVLWLPLRQKKGTSLLLRLWLVTFCMQLVFNQKLSVYLVHIMPYFAALTAVWLATVWRTSPRLRWLAVVPVVLAFVIQPLGLAAGGSDAGGAASRERVVAVANRTCPAAREIVASASLLYAFRFDRRVVDDHRLGLVSGRVPDVIVVDDFIRERWHDFETDKPPLMAAIRERLGHYHRVSRDGRYDVYVGAGCGR